MFHAVLKPDEGNDDPETTGTGWLSNDDPETTETGWLSSQHRQPTRKANESSGF